MKPIALISIMFLVNCLSIDAAIGDEKIAREALIVYTGNLLAELKPCGCSKEEDQGGIERRMQYLKDIRKEYPEILLVDTGDHFKEPTRQGKLKAETLLTATEKMHYDAVALGDRDLLYGPKFLANRKQVPWISSNLISGIFKPAEFKIKTFANGLRVGVLAVVDPDLFYNHSDLKIYDPLKTISTLLNKIHKKDYPDLIILLSHAEREASLKYLDIEGVDIVINGHIVSESDVIDMKPVFKNGKVFVQSSPRGQKMGELKVQLSSNGNKTFKHNLVKLDSSIKFDPEMIKLYQQYNEKVEAIFFEDLAGKRNKNKQSIYAGETVCKTCHMLQHEIWSESRHSHAYSTLRKINKAFDPECLVCHVVGFNLPGGFISELDSPGLKNVQCEVCHGAGRTHASAPQPGFGNKAKETCKNCHKKNHSPRFDYEKYWPRIRH